MRYAVTGSTGFIGTALCNRLQKEGHVIMPVPRAAMEDERSIKHWIDWADPDTIIHLAAYGNHYSQKDVDLTLFVNAHCTMNLFMASRGKPVYNFTSSSMNLKVQTPYSISKQIGQLASQLYSNVVNIMPYSVYGPGEGHHRFIPIVIRSLINNTRIELDEGATHDWIYIEDFIDAFMNGHTTIGSGRAYTNLEVVKHLEMITGRQLTYIPKKLRSYDNSVWCAPFGVQHISIEQGLLNTYMHYKSKYS